MEQPAFLEAVGFVAGAEVLDLGCGDGSTAPLLIERGARSYLGVDASAAMIRVAHDRYASPTATFRCAAVESLALDECAFDLVVSRMALHYVADIEPVVAMVHRSLRPGGRFVFTVSHPVITSYDASTGSARTNWIVDDYFARGPRDRPWFGGVARWHHRTVEDHVRPLVVHGFVVDALSECEPSVQALAGMPEELERRRRVPLILLLAASRR